MQRDFSSLVAISVLVGAALVLAACGTPETVSTDFTVEGMHCEACSSAITAALEKTEGVVEASADHELGWAVAVHDPGVVTPETLKAEIEELGYTVTGMSTEAVEG